MRFRFFDQVAIEGFFYGLFFERIFAQKNFSICSFGQVLRLLKKSIYIYFITFKTRLKLHIEKAADAALAFFGLSQLRFNTGLRIAAMVVNPWPFGRRFGWH